MKNWKILLGIILIVFGFVLFVSCEGGADNKMGRDQSRIMSEAYAQIGMPNINNFSERKMMKMILELRDRNDLVNYVYLWSDVQGKLIYFGKCIGYGLPYATQYTNPSRTVGTYGATLPQADPNGLFMPESANATWLMMIDPATNQPKITYVEPNVIVSPIKLAD